MNPMIRKELRERMRERRGWILPTLYLVALACVAGFYYFATLAEEFQLRMVQPADVGMGLFLSTTFAQLTLLLLLVPVFSAATITSEREQRTLSSLLVTLLTPFEIWLGKMTAALLFLVLLLVTGLPLVSLALAFGGVTPADVARTSFTIFVVLGAMSTLGVLWSTTFRRSVHATAVAYISIVAITLVTAVAYGIATWWWSSLPVESRGAEQPWYIDALLWINPYTTLGAATTTTSSADWLISLACFAVLALAAATLAIRRLKRIEP